MAKTTTIDHPESPWRSRADLVSTRALLWVVSFAIAHSVFLGEVAMPRDLSVVVLGDEDQRTIATIVQQRYGTGVATIDAVRLGATTIDATIRMVPDRYGRRWKSFLRVSCVKTDGNWRCDKAKRDVRITRGKEEHEVLELPESTSEDEAVQVFDLCWELAAMRAVTISKQGDTFDVNGSGLESGGPHTAHIIGAIAQLGDAASCRRVNEY